MISSIIQRGCRPPRRHCEIHRSAWSSFSLVSLIITFGWCVRILEITVLDLATLIYLCNLYFGAFECHILVDIHSWYTPFLHLSGTITYISVVIYLSITDQRLPLVYSSTPRGSEQQVVQPEIKRWQSGSLPDIGPYLQRRDPPRQEAGPAAY